MPLSGRPLERHSAEIFQVKRTYILTLSPLIRNPILCVNYEGVSTQQIAHGSAVYHSSMAIMTLPRSRLPKDARLRFPTSAEGEKKVSALEGWSGSKRS